MARRTWYSIKAVQNAPAEIAIFDEIGGWGVSAAMFLAEFKALPGNDVHLLINSPGGDVMQATAIMTGMQMSGKNIRCTVMGIAASAAAYVLLAAQHRVMPENTFQFLHDPLTGLRGDAEELRAAADQLDLVASSIVGTYATRTGRAPDEIKALFAGDTLLTAQECLDLGLCDEVTPAVEISAKFDPDRPDLPEAVQVLLRKAAPQPAAAVPFVEQVRAMADRAGLGEFAPVFALDANITTADQARLAISDAAEVRALCSIAGQADMAARLIQQRVDLKAAREAIQAVLAEADAAAHTDNAPPAPKGALPAPKAKYADFTPTSYYERFQK